ncbi:MAG: hypothetical protein ACRDSG_04055 [Pseudonocardiaceae bacterium]
MTHDVDWPNGWEGGRDAVRDYWQRQWAAVDSTAEPIAVNERPDAKSRSRSTYSFATRRETCSSTRRSTTSNFRGDLVQRMTIEE